MRRRELLAATSAATASSLAGCLENLINWIADQVLEDVNVFNEMDRSVSGTILVQAPDGTEVLSAAFDLEAGEGDLEDESAGVTYADILTEAGTYTVDVTLEVPIEGMDTAAETVEVTDPADDHIVVGLGAPDAAEPITILSVASFTDIGDELEE